jgi:hypothetical protein
VSVVAHFGGIPIEETVASAGPALFVAFGAAWANLRARVHAVTDAAGQRDTETLTIDYVDATPD